MGKMVNWQDHRRLVEVIARRMMRNLPSSIEFNDVLQLGMMGLLDASGKYDDSEGAQFETYATTRIRGAIMDGLREMDFLSRSTRSAIRRAEAVIRRLEQSLLRRPRDSEVAEVLGMTLDEYVRLYSYRDIILYYEDVSTSDKDGRPFLDTWVFEDKANDPLESLIVSEETRSLAVAHSRLPDRLRAVLELYHKEDLTLHEIGERLRVSESRICQLYGQAIKRLRKILGSVDIGTAKNCFLCMFIADGKCSSDEASVMASLVDEDLLCEFHRRERIAALEIPDSPYFGGDDDDP